MILTEQQHYARSLFDDVVGERYDESATPPAGDAADEVIGLGITGLALKRSDWWQRVPLREGPRGFVQTKNGIRHHADNFENEIEAA